MDGVCDISKFTKETIDAKLKKSKFYNSLICAIDKYLNKNLSVDFVD